MEQVAVDQALELRRLAAEKREAAGEARPSPATSRGMRIVAVTSGKGGVGKTSFTINFAMALAEQGIRVVILDADLGMANVNVALGMAVRSSLHDVVQGDRSLFEVMVEGPGGIKIIPGGSGVQELAEIDEAARGRLLEQIADLAKVADVLLIDTAAGINKNVLGFACAADTVVVVTVPEPPAIADAYGMIKSLLTRKRDADVRLVVNRTMRPFEGKAVFEKLDLVIHRFLGVRITSFGSIPEDDAVPDCVRRQQAVVLEVPNSAASKAVKRLAEVYLGDRREGQGGVRGFLQRLVRWFG
jgi:flagellar biosynthesis protein FlhG